MLLRPPVRLLGGVVGWWLVAAVAAAGEPTLHGPPRFGVRGGRHRVVLPLGAPYGGTPRFRARPDGVEVWLPGAVAGDDVRGRTFVPPHGDRVIRSVTVSAARGAAVVRLRRRRPAGAEAWVLTGPPRVAVDLIEGARRPRQTRTAARKRRGNRTEARKVASRGSAEGARRARQPEPAAPLAQGAGGGGTNGTPGVESTAAMCEPPTAAPGATAAPTAGKEGWTPEGAPPQPVATGQNRVSTERAAQAEPAELPSPRIVEVNGRPFVWPALDSHPYSGPALEELGGALRTWHDHGEGPTGRWRGEPPPGPAGRYLAADLAYLEAAAGEHSFLVAADLYRRALRAGPFPDATRARFLLAQCYANARLAPEAEAAFARLARDVQRGTLAAAARLGEGRALRWGHRYGRAVKVLGEAAAMGGEMGCRAAAELADLERELGELPAAIGELAAVERDCPRVAAHPAVLRVRAELLRATGRAGAARAVLQREPVGGTSADRDALALLAGELAAEAGNVDGARELYVAVRSRAEDRAVVADAAIRLAGLEADRKKAAALLAEVYEGDFPRAARAEALVAAARLRLQDQAYEGALALLDRASRLGPAGRAEAESTQGEVISRWLASLAAAHRPGEVVTVYERYRSFEDLLSPEARLLAAEALAASGLPREAGTVAARLAGSAAGLPMARALAVKAESELAAGDTAAASASAGKLLSMSLPEELARRARAIAARAALAAGDPAGAERAAGPEASPPLRIDLAEAYIAAGSPERAIAILEPVIGDMARAGGALGARALVAVARAREAAGHLEAAAEQYGAALGKAPAEARKLAAGYRLAGVEERLGHPGAAAAHYREVAADGSAWLRRAAAAEAALLEVMYGDD